MNVNRVIEVPNRDPVAGVREFLAAWWNEVDLDAILAPVEIGDGSGARTQVLDDPGLLSTVNPFVPVMMTNAATAIGKFSRDHPDGRLAALLRPCEVRALVELRKRRHGAAAADKVVVIGVDCLGTFPPSEFSERLRAEGEPALMQEALTYAAEGEPWPHRGRTACRTCLSPAPRGAEIALGAFGVRPEEYLLLIARDEATDDRYRLERVAPRTATEEQVVRREVAVGKIADCHSRTRQELVQSAPLRFRDLGSLLSWLTGCTLCGDCLDACPLYDGELAGLLGLGGNHYSGQGLLAELVDASRWLACCAGCGMCEEACSSDVPLSQFILALTHRIQEELHYTPGDPDQRLPWMAG